MMNNNYLHNIIYLIVIITLVGCSNSAETNNDANLDEDLIQITEDQYKSSKMEIGELSLQEFEETVTCNGYISAPTEGIANISTAITGMVNDINFSIGDYVTKGQTLCTLSSFEFIELQQEYIESCVLQKTLEADYNRSNTLFEENIGTQKELNSIKSDFKVMQAKYQSLKLRLELLGMDTKKIETNDLYKMFPIKAPISGYITSKNLVMGDYIAKDETLFEIVDMNSLQLQIFVFDEDISSLKSGQKIKFSTIGNSEVKYNATLKTFGKSIDKDSKTIICIAKIDDDKSSFVKGSYIEAKVIVQQTKTIALPSDAVQKSENEYYVFKLEKTENKIYYLKKYQVNVGRTSESYIEILGDSKLTNIVTKGVYNLPVD